MNKFLQDLKVALGVAYLNDVKANRVFISPINMTCNQRHEAPLWMNVRFQGCVVGVDICGINNKNTLTVTIFVRSIQNVRIASAAMPQQSGVWLSSCPNIVKIAGGIFSLAFYGVGGWRPICQYDIAQTAPSKVVQQLSMLLNCFGPVV